MSSAARLHGELDAFVSQSTWSAKYSVNGSASSLLPIPTSFWILVGRFNAWKCCKDPTSCNEHFLHR
ncbi:hypothetical protein BJV74DRAFT_845939 [Russula compacta]|nr:hypothetical protein BJV74DRAFT_845939 [Russula compacta]